jgi:hypothetical protein
MGDTRVISMSAISRNNFLILLVKTKHKVKRFYENFLSCYYVEDNDSESVYICM